VDRGGKCSNFKGGNRKEGGLKKGGRKKEEQSPTPFPLPLLPAPRLTQTHTLLENTVREASLPQTMLAKKKKMDNSILTVELCTQTLASIKRRIWPLQCFLFLFSGERYLD